MALEPCQKKCEKHRPPMMDLEGCGRREPKSVEADDVRSAAVRCVSSVGSGVKPRRAHNPKVFQVKSELARRSWSIRSARAPSTCLLDTVSALAASREVAGPHRASGYLGVFAPDP